MKIEVQDIMGVSVLYPKGKITIGAGDISLRAGVDDCLNSGATKILINMEGVTTIDSSGVGELISSYTRTVNRGGKLKICNLPDKVNDVLTVTQLITVFDVYEDEMEAVESF
ncbi:MAG: STAS domain-containing protein [Saprospiraceae bacterium]|nr:STAS domain-containing protein [Saprospiraceae bacterium]